MTSISDLVNIIGGSLQNCDDVLAQEHVIIGMQTLIDADNSHAAFLANRRYKADFHDSKAGVVLLNETDFADCKRSIIRVQDPYLAFARLQQYWHPKAIASGIIHASAIIDPDAVIAADVNIGANTVIAAGCVLASGCIIGAGCVLEKNVCLGTQCLLHARVVCEESCILGDRVIVQAGAVIGSDGFGYAWSGHDFSKIPQVGRVLIGNDVEIGACCTIDRGAVGDTIINDGVKIDNLVQIGHNVQIGAHTVIAAQTGISGSSNIGRYCQMGGQTGIAGHLAIADGCKLAGKSGVTHNLVVMGTYGGFPAMPQKLWLKANAALRRLVKKRKD
ncbi:MAG: UDP-3-O-(3-hydroxymyristoyl)glucosamine N-acyltransferase [Mariprofundales bacterium]